MSGPRPGNGNAEPLKKAMAAGTAGRNNKGKPRGCNPQEMAFVDHYVQHWNYTAAAKAAGYSEKTAYCTGQKVGIKPHVKAEIEKRLEAFKADYRQTHQALAQFLTNVIYQDVTDILEIKDGENGKQIVGFKTDGVLQNGSGKMFNSITIGGRHGLKVEIFSKQAAAEMLAKHIGFFKEDNTQKTPVGPNIYLPDNGRSSDQPTGE